MSTRITDQLATTTSGNTLYEILGLPRPRNSFLSNADTQCIVERAAKLLADIPFVAAYLETFASEQVECWQDNERIQYKQIMQAYADAQSHARGQQKGKARVNFAGKRAIDGHEKTPASHVLLGIASAASQEQMKAALKKQLLMMKTISGSLCLHAMKFWSEGDATCISAKEYVQWEHIHVAKELLLDNKWRGDYDEWLATTPDPFYHCRTTRRAIYCWRSTQGDEVQSLRLQQLQRSSIWRTVPAAEDFQAMQDELRYIFAAYLANHDFRNYDELELQRMEAQSRQALLAERPAEQGGEPESHLSTMRQHRFEDELAILQKVQARHYIYRKLNRMSIEEMQAHKETVEQRFNQEKEQLQFAFREYQAMRENDKQEPWEPIEYQQLWYSTDYSPSPLSALGVNEWPWVEQSVDGAITPAMVEIRKLEFRADFRDLEIKLTKKNPADQQSLTAMMYMMQEQFFIFESSAMREALWEELLICRSKLHWRRNRKHSLCKECKEYQTEGQFPREMDGRIARHQRCRLCAFPFCRACDRQRQESEGPAPIWEKEMNQAGCRDAGVWFCNQEKCKHNRQRKCSACKVSKPGKEFARDGHNHHERCLSCEYPTCAACGFKRPRDQRAVREDYKDEQRNWYCQPTCRPKRS